MRKILAVLILGLALVSSCFADKVGYLDLEGDNIEYKILKEKEYPVSLVLGYAKDTMRLVSVTNTNTGYTLYVVEAWAEDGSDIVKISAYRTLDSALCAFILFSDDECENYVRLEPKHSKPFFSERDNKLHLAMFFDVTQK